MRWDQNCDNFRFSVKLNSSPRRKKIHTGPNLSAHQIPSCLPLILSKQMISSQVNGIYDLLGLATPFTVKAKEMMKQLWCGEAKELGWDDDIPTSMKHDWIRFFEEIFLMEQISFKRCTLREESVCGRKF